jgi:hypothetical protein
LEESWQLAWSTLSSVVSAANPHVRGRDEPHVEIGMKIFTSLFFLICLGESAWAQVSVPGPEMSAGVIGMTLAAGVVYLITRRKRS